jgi:hypothetical protein
LFPTLLDDGLHAQHQIVNLAAYDGLFFGPFADWEIPHALAAPVALPQVPAGGGFSKKKERICESPLFLHGSRVFLGADAILLEP